MPMSERERERVTSGLCYFWLAELIEEENKMAFIILVWKMVLLFSLYYLSSPTGINENITTPTTPYYPATAAPVENRSKSLERERYRFARKY